MKDSKKAPPLSGRYDCENVHGCNGCDAVKVGLNEHGYCKECAEAPREGQMKTKTQHTLGPWKWEKLASSGWSVYTMKCVKGAIDAMTGRDLANYDSKSRVALVLQESGESTARLIAASPDLLSAAKQALDEMGDFQKGESMAVDMLRAAIAKAEGKEVK